MRSTKVTWNCDFCPAVVEGVAMPSRWQRYMIGQLDAKGKVQTPHELALCGTCVDSVIDQTSVGFFRAFARKLKGIL